MYGQQSYNVTTPTVYASYPHSTVTTTQYSSNTNPSVVVLNQPHVIHGQQVQREWSSGMCACCQDCKTCCCAFWCYPCFLCILSKDMGENFCGPVFCGAATRSGGCPNAFATAMRTRMRSKYGIQGSICKDCCCMTFCEFCMTTQMARELKHAGNIFQRV